MEVPCLSHQEEEEGCPAECLQSKKVVFEVKNKEKLKCSYSDACAIIPYPLDTLKISPLSPDEDHYIAVYKAVSIEKPTFLLFLALVVINRERNFPPCPFGNDSTETLTLLPGDAEILSKMTPDYLFTFFSCALYFDQINTARLCALYLTEKYIKGQKVSEIQEIFNLPANSLPSDLYLAVIDKYGLCFHPDRDCFNVENTVGDLTNFNGISCAGMCELETYLNRQFGSDDWSGS